MMDATTGQRSRINLGSTLRAHKATLVALPLLGALLALGLGSLLPTDYVATTQVLIQPLEGNPYNPTGQGSDLVNLETEASVAGSDVVTQDVLDNIDPSYRKDNIAKLLSVSVASNTQIIQLAYEGTDKAMIEAIADQYAESYLNYRKSRRDTLIGAKEDQLNERAGKLTDQLDKLQNAGKGNNSPQVKAVGGQLLNVRLQLAALDTTSSPGEVIAEAKAKSVGLQLPPYITVPLGLIAGFVVAIAIAFTRVRRADLLHTFDDIEYLGVPVIGQGVDPGEIVADLPPSSVAMMTGVVLHRRVEAPATIAVSSIGTSVPVGPFAQDLARVLGRGQQSVLLIDAASQEPSAKPGLSDALQRTGRMRQQGDPTPGVTQVPIGRDPEQAAELLSSSRMGDLLQDAQDRYPWVMVQGQDAGQAPGRATVGACHYWVLVVELEATNRAELARGLSWAKVTGTRPLGVVVLTGRTTKKRRLPSWLRWPRLSRRSRTPDDE